MPTQRQDFKVDLYFVKGKQIAPEKIICGQASRFLLNPTLDEAVSFF
jgi:hypothetical protein